MYILEKYLPYKIVVFIIIFLFITNILTIFYCFKTNKCEPCLCEECPVLSQENNKEINNDKIKVDIKGYVKKPGVYELENDSIVNELIKIAGGLKKEATTENINLSKKLKDEDMVVILSKSELKKKNTIVSNTSSNNMKTILDSTDNNITSTMDATSKKININTATKEELMTLNGIGEAKAISIIEYRTTTPFKDISEIKNISGIGESIYEKIKDTITV